MSPIIILNPPVAPPTGALTLATAQTELAARGFDYLPLSRMTIMLNDAKNLLEDTWEYPWLLATVTGPAPLTITNLKYVLSVKTALGGELMGIDIRQLAQGNTDLAQAGEPAYWYLDADVNADSTLKTWPVSGIDLTVAFVVQSPELSAPGDFPMIPARYHSLWLDFAVVQAYQDSDNFIGAQSLQADCNARVHALIERYETRNRQHAGFIAQRYLSEDD